MLNAQLIKQKGIPLIKNFKRSEYNAGRQNWCIVQDDRNLLYFANNNGILEFDGSKWRTYYIPNNSIIRSLAIGNENQVFFGAYNDIGFLYPNINGELKYISLVKKISKDDRDFGEVWKIFQTNDGVLFQSFNYIFKYKNDTVYTVYKYGDFHFSFYVNNTLYIKDNDAGLKELTESGLRLIPGGEVFINKEIWTIFPIENDRLLIGTANHGIYIYDGKSVSEWNIELNKFFKKNQIFSGVKINENKYAYGTIQNGIIIINNQGEILQHINREKGIQNNTILSMFLDNEENLWLGLDNGIDYIKINSPITYLNPKKEIGTGYTSIVYEENLYLGTNQGLFYISGNSLIMNYEYKLVENTKGQVWKLSIIDGKLFCGHNRGVYLINNNIGRLISEIDGGWIFIKLPGYKDNIILGTYTGLVTLKKQNNSWKYKNKIKGFNESSHEIEVDRKGNLWISHSYKGIYKVCLNDKLDSVIELSFYNINKGLPSEYQNTVLKFKQEIVVSTNNGFYTYNNNSDGFIEHKKLNNIFGRKKVSKLIEDNNGNIWFFQNNEIGVLRLNYDGTYSKEILPYYELYSSFVQGFEDILPIDNNNILIGSEEGFIHFAPSEVKYNDKQNSVLLREVRFTKNDSVLYGGNAISKTTKKIISDYNNEAIYLKYKNNALKFTFSVPDYTNTNNIKYSYKLVGFEDNWSEWKTDNEKEYLNLNQGDYVFKVKARDVYNYETDETTFAFSIHPPWYASIVAFVLYAIIIAVSLFLTIKFIVKRYEKEKEQLKEKQKKELKAKEEQHAQEVSEAEQEIIKLQNEKLEIDLQMQKVEIENKSKELASIAMQITYKNEILDQIKNRLTKVSQKMIHEESKKQVLNLIKTIEKDMLHEEDWDKFEYHFDQVHEDFMKKLRINYPGLTPKDLKLCAYLRMNLSTKEIAPLLNISVRGVEVHRYRLRKKMDLDRNSNLTDFLLSV